ncbi:MAG: hypothetical protein WBE61_14530 [Nitrososphaeraceae archaeon]
MELHIRQVNTFEEQSGISCEIEEWKSRKIIKLSSSISKAFISDEGG